MCNDSIVLEDKTSVFHRDESLKAFQGLCLFET